MSQAHVAHNISHVTHNMYLNYTVAAAAESAVARLWWYMVCLGMSDGRESGCNKNRGKFLISLNFGYSE